jgi:hypothetical protein
VVDMPKSTRLTTGDILLQRHFLLRSRDLQVVGTLGAEILFHSPFASYRKRLLSASNIDRYRNSIKRCLANRRRIVLIVARDADMDTLDDSGMRFRAHPC